ELLPDVGQVLDARAEQIDALPAGDLRVEAVLLGDAPEHDELLGRDLAPRNARDYRVEARPLDVREEAIVRVLKRRAVVREDEVVMDAREDRRDRWLADLAAEASSVVAKERIEGPDTRGGDDLKELLAGVCEVLAEARLDRLAQGFELGVHDVGDERHA